MEKTSSVNCITAYADTIESYPPTNAMPKVVQDSRSCVVRLDHLRYHPVATTDGGLTVTINAPTETAIVLVDPISTGCVLAHQCLCSGDNVIRVWSNGVPESLRNHVVPGLKADFSASIDHVSVENTLAALAALPYTICDVLVGCETGVLTADKLSAALGVRGNGMEKSRARRDKFMQTEEVRASGAAAAYQALCASAEDVDHFLSEHPVFTKLVVKPNDGAGSEGVEICSSADEVRAAFARLAGATNALGLSNTSVLLMEFLEGTEFVVDTVSRDGVHKVTAIWQYEKGMFFGSPVVYFGMHLLPLDSTPELAAMVDYVVGSVLPAVGIANGAVHSEIILTRRGPVLVEANCRLHGSDGGWVPVAEACLGYSQVSALRDAYTCAEAFAALPIAPRSTTAGAMVFIRSPVAGVLTRVREYHLAALHALSSFRGMRIVPTAGARIEITKDLLTACGIVLLVNEDSDAFKADYEAAQRIIDEGLFEVAPPTADEDVVAAAGSAAREAAIDIVAAGGSAVARLAARAAIVACVAAVIAIGMRVRARA